MMHTHSVNLQGVVRVFLLGPRPRGVAPQSSASSTHGRALHRLPIYAPAPAVYNLPNCGALIFDLVPRRWAGREAAEERGARQLGG